MARRPPLNAIRAFEAAARHESCLRAARELGVTHGAVSRQIKVLETFFGIELFRRTGTGLRLTKLGTDYYSSVSPALALLDQASAVVAAPTLSINTLPTFATNWLFPRMAGLKEACPEVGIEIATSLRSLSELTKEFDLYIRREGGETPGFWKRRLVGEYHVPVCAPSYLRQSRGPPDLIEATILHCAARPGAWPEWLETHAASPRLRGASQTFESLYICLQAAIDGVGIAMGASTLVEQHIADGTLVQPFGSRYVQCTPYFLVSRRDPAPGTPLALACDYLAREGAAHDAIIATRLTDDEAMIPSPVDGLRRPRP